MFENAGAWSSKFDGFNDILILIDVAYAGVPARITFRLELFLGRILAPIVSDDVECLKGALGGLSRCDRTIG